MTPYRLDTSSPHDASCVNPFHIHLKSGYDNLECTKCQNDAWNHTPPCRRGLFEDGQDLR